MFRFPKNKIVSDESVETLTLPNHTKNFYKNIIQYLDEHIYFTYLKASDALYGMNFESQLPYYLRQDVSVNTALIVYFRRYPDHDEDEVDPLLLSMIEMELNDL